MNKSFTAIKEHPVKLNTKEVLTYLQGGELGHTKPKGFDATQYKRKNRELTTGTKKGRKIPTNIHTQQMDSNLTVELYVTKKSYQNLFKKLNFDWIEKF